MGAYGGATYDLQHGTADYLSLRPSTLDLLPQSARASVRANESVALHVEGPSETLRADGPRANLTFEARPGELWRVRAHAPATVKGTITITWFAPGYLVVGGLLAAAGSAVLVVARRRAGSP
ncbi:MAG TPA: hypothetical protein VM681_07300 [Candidatus Thermoplasmatota archaeon]|nr:hypothetical protein [Candidatus Thermoplasmatota archaeon]